MATIIQCPSCGATGTIRQGIPTGEIECGRCKAIIPLRPKSGDERPAAAEALSTDPVSQQGDNVLTDRVSPTGPASSIKSLDKFFLDFSTGPRRTRGATVHLSPSLAPTPAQTRAQTRTEPRPVPSTLVQPAPAVNDVPVAKDVPPVYDVPAAKDAPAALPAPTDPPAGFGTSLADPVAEREWLREERQRLESYMARQFQVLRQQREEFSVWRSKVEAGLVMREQELGRAAKGLKARTEALVAREAGLARRLGDVAAAEANLEHAQQALAARVAEVEEMEVQLRASLENREHQLALDAKALDARRHALVEDAQLEVEEMHRTVREDLERQQREVAAERQELRKGWQELAAIRRKQRPMLDLNAAGMSDSRRNRVIGHG